jgi:hypothetical protein
MIRFLMEVLFFTFHLATPIVAQESIQSKKVQKITEKQLGDTNSRITKNRGKSDKSDRGDQSPQDSQNTAGGADVVLTAGSFNLSRETILGMDPTIALFVVFSVFLVLVVAIVALSQGGRPHD